MEFAKRQMLKYGWSEGKGLGRLETGITEALKPKLKFDTTGIGHDYAKEFTNNWWDQVYNSAVKNINIASVDGGILVSTADDSSSKNDPSVKKRKRSSKKVLEYGTFLKTSVLTGDGTVRNTTTATPEDEEIITESFKTLTDEELFKICGGRTAHKGARHGLKLNGKLARIEKQEQKLYKKLPESCPNSGSKLSGLCVDVEEQPIEKFSFSNCEDSNPYSEKKKKNKKKKKKDKMKHQEEEDCVNAKSLSITKFKTADYLKEKDSNYDSTDQKKYMQSGTIDINRRRKQNVIELENEQICESIPEKKKKKKRKSTNCEEIV